MAEIKMDYDVFEPLVSALETSIEKGAAVSFGEENNTYGLGALEIYEKCICAMNSLIIEFAEFAGKDAGSLRQIIADWLGTDRILAGKNVNDLLKEIVNTSVGGLTDGK